MTFLHALVLGIVEGITEFLPISSTGHLILTSHLLGLPETEFVKSFEIAIQLGAILAALLLYWRSLLLDARILGKTILAFIPTGVAGLLLYKTIKSLLGDERVVLWSLLVGGIALIVVEARSRPADNENRDGGIASITWAQSFVIGCAQIVSMIPGVSRAAATIVAGLLMGISRRTIVEFSFLLAIPTMAAATGYDLLRHYRDFSSAQFGVLAVGFLVSFVMAVIAIEGLLGYIRHHTLASFGIYRIVLAIVFWLLV
jgi:undecaprenyl-diphosphatase